MGNLQIKIVVLTIVMLLTSGSIYRVQEDRKREFIKTADIEFTRCRSDHSLWCLTIDQYITIIQQLSARKDCEDDKDY